MIDEDEGKRQAKAVAAYAAQIVDLPAVKKRVDILVEKGVTARRGRPVEPSKTTTALQRVDALQIKQRIAEALGDMGDGCNAEIPSTWTPTTRADIFGMLLPAWAAAAFERTPAAKMLGVHVSMVNSWLDSPEWNAWATDPSRRTHKLAAVVDLALERAADILMRDSSDTRFLAIQAGIAKQVIKSGAGMQRRIIETPAPEPPPPEDPPSLHDRMSPQHPIIDINQPDE